MQGRLPEVPLGGVKHSRFRKFLFILLGLSVVFALASMVIPYDLRPDGAARFHLEDVVLKRDRSNYWLTLHLQKSGDAPHDFQKPVRLLTASGRELEPADTTFAGDAGPGIREIWFKFWLDPADLDGPLSLQLNDGRLRVRTSDKPPRMADGLVRTFITHYW